MSTWMRRGTPWVWLNAGAVAISILMVVGLLALLTVRGMSHFWPRDVMQANYTPPTSSGELLSTQVIGEFVESEMVLSAQIASSGIPVDEAQGFYERQLLKLGNRDLTGADFTWVLRDFVHDVEYPENVVALERREWGNFYGHLSAIKEDSNLISFSGDAAAIESARWNDFNERLERALDIREDIYVIENQEIGQINYAMERLRLRERRLELDQELTPEALAEIDSERAELDEEYDLLQIQLIALYETVNRDSAIFIAANGEETEVSFADIVRAYKPNQLSLIGKIGTYSLKLGEFLTAEPREANTEGGIFPAIFGTVMMVMLMSVFVTPFGVVAAVYLREYARQGIVTRAIRIAVNNLAGVPSIVYGVFGLGFFIYIIGSEVDQIFYPEALPAPTFGTPGLLWASLTLALLTVPVVIVATEEGLARIPRSVREGSLALGATKFETLWRVVLPMASPAMMTGLILAVARAAGEVAPLMLVGVVKLAPSLPLDGNYPYLHLEQKFMHLGFHIYDVGFQSPNIEAARPLVFATALLLVIVIAGLNLTAVALRNHLREKYKALDV
ncbi:MAG: phosphate ABC transporter permease PstA [Gammaproteobacteria bacterium]|nr:phosphate ABC transporter permease PstA [Gammaproteobacteria bacterium]MBT6481947.1 phosphate ABC transporter permease PstA [Gammaproteobacteria bacterium]MBT7226320.1 phosphate ABC transporter permease PstA [Gammaproteobacteria bacterium]MDB3909495.1 phosphate ABC transporter permease PstA [Gammaproteobacteria bacterium]MDC0413536.1 phosphate ABC transporter permease PstA [Gammaproteobacteria bacterium]